jgi:uncharacterized protein
MTTLKTIREWSVTQTLHPIAPLETVLEKLQFVQADPIRAPARAQDLILRPRVTGYKVDDLEKLYPNLSIEEDFFVNYGFLHSNTVPLFHPRTLQKPLQIELDAPELLGQVLEFVRDNGATHPKQLEAHFGKRRVGNYWGGTSIAATRALEGLHRQGRLRVARREKGIKVYEHAEQRHTTLSPEARATGILQLILRNYAPLPLPSLLQLCGFTHYGAPELYKQVRTLAQKLETQTTGGTRWVLPPAPPSVEPHEAVTLLAPFDPIVWDRRRFALLHGWDYRFEAYTKPEKRVRGYYALPMLYGADVVGWANVSGKQGFQVELGYIQKPRSQHFAKALKSELERMEWFLGASHPQQTP